MYISFKSCVDTMDLITVQNKSLFFITNIDSEKNIKIIQEQYFQFFEQFPTSVSHS